MDFENADILAEAELMSESDMMVCDDYDKCEDCPLVEDCRRSESTVNEAATNRWIMSPFVAHRYCFGKERIF